MLGSTHSRIAQKIAEELEIREKRSVDLLVNGSNAPDSWVNFPHHRGKEREIKENILKARKSFLQGDDECFHLLGIALHYIADKWTLRPRIEDKHTRWERLIDTSPFLKEVEFKKQMEEASLPSRAQHVHTDPRDKFT